MISIYIAAMVAANLLVWWLGPWFSPINSFLLIGLDLTLRDVMHDRLTKWQMFGVIAAGGAITWAANPSAAHIAIASATAFGASALADWAVYARLRSRSWLVRSNGSNVVGAAVDSAIFPTLAFVVLAANPKSAAVLASIIGLQFVAKVAGGAAWSGLVQLVRNGIKWDEWRGNGKPAMWLKRVFYIASLGWRLDLHKFVGNDDPECFHTHPGICIRLILWNEYTEEILMPDGTRRMKTWRAGMIGIVRPEFCHRQAALRSGKPCYTAWLRLKPKHKVRLVGSGWPQNSETMSKSHLDVRQA